jgi:hypothetical protein
MNQHVKPSSWITIFATILIAYCPYVAGGQVLFSSNFSASPLIPSIQTNTSGVAKKPKKSKKAKHKGAGGVTFYEGSAETRDERDRRLMRECRGSSNSGVCAGYTRP